MKRIFASSFIILMLAISACSNGQAVPTKPSATAKPSATEATIKPTEAEIPEKPEVPEPWTPAAETLVKIPYESRRFVISNGIDIRIVEENLSTDGTEILSLSNSLSGFRDTGIEKKLNEEIENNLIMISDEVKAEALASTGNAEQRIVRMQLSTNVIYSCTNVMFVEFFAYAEYPELGGISYVQKFNSVGYDLNTGKKLELSDLFRKDFNHVKYLNDKILMFIIENNYDDPDSGFLSGPFKGIREDQSFSFDLSGVKIIIDEKNDEFVSLGYPLTIVIPLREIGDSLAIFDRFMVGEETLFLKEGTRKLLPNIVEYRLENVFEDFSEAHAVNITTGRFYGISDSALLERLNGLSSSKLDAEGFLTKAKAYNEVEPDKYYGSMNHDVQIMMNKGGFLSIVFMDLIYELGNENISRKFVNIDMTEGKDMLLKDVFIEGFDYAGKILDTAGLNKDVASVQENDFYFDEDGIYVTIFQKDENLGVLNSWIPFEDLGFENISIYSE